jgi:hypothetical protein
MYIDRLPDDTILVMLDMVGMAFALKKALKYFLKTHFAHNQFNDLEKIWHSSVCKMSPKSIPAGRL